MKKFLLLSILCIILSIGSYARTPQQSSSVITQSMAKKIGYFCRYNDRAMILFAQSNADVVQNRRDIAEQLLWSLENHLDYAENFLIMLYDVYGKQLAYSSLNNMNFTPKEHDIADSLYQRVQRRRQEIKEQKEQERIKQKLESEQRILDLADNGHIFPINDLYELPVVHFNIKELAHQLKYLQISNSYFECGFNCIISKDGTLSLENTADYETFSDIEQWIWDYIEKNAIVKTLPAIKLEQMNRVVNVAAKSRIRIENDIDYYPSEITAHIKKNKKQETLMLLNEKRLRARYGYWIDTLKDDLQDNPQYKNISSGKFTIKGHISSRKSLIYYLNGEKEDFMNSPQTFILTKFERQ